MIKTEKTIYDELEPSDGLTILVMSIWPRGIKKDKVDLWLKELGTDRELIKQWKAGEISWAKFAREYKKSLRGKEALLQMLAKESKKKTLTLLCSCKDKHCHRFLLKEEIEHFC